MSAVDRQQVVLASNNQGKLRELGELLKKVDIDLLPQSLFNPPVTEETGKTFVENAILKARAAAAVSGLPAIADDSGIEVDVLNGAPGIYSARYAGENATDSENLQLLLENVAKSGAERPTARFQCVVVYLRHALDAMPVIAEGTWEGYIVQAPRGENGFGYDPVFYLPEHECTSAELPPEKKNRISHRGQAIRRLLARLEDINH